MEDVIYPSQGRASSGLVAHLNIPVGGLVFPSAIRLPSVADSVANINQYAVQLGFNLPKSYSRKRIIQRMKEILLGLGYQEESAFGLSRNQPVRLMPLEIPEAISQSQGVSLPAVVSRSVFLSKESLNDFISQNNLSSYIQSYRDNNTARGLRQFLAEHQYAIGHGGDFIRLTPLQLEGGYEYQDLVLPEHYREFIYRTESVPVIQDDLLKLQVTILETLPFLSKKKWATLNDFVNDLSDQLEIRPDLGLLVTLLSRFRKLTSTEVQKILDSMGTTTVYGTDKKRSDALLGYIRTRLQVIPKIYPENRRLRTEKATRDLTFDQVLDGGYDFDPSDFIADINRSSEILAQYQLKFLANLYRNHPEIYRMAKQYTPRSTLTNKIIEVYYIQPPTYPQTIYAFTVNWPIVIPEPEERKVRRIQLESLPQKYHEALYGIHRTRNWEEIIDKPENPLETHLQAFPKIKIDQLSQKALEFGMVVPEHLLRNQIRGYILEHIASYRDVLAKSKQQASLDELEYSESFTGFLSQLGPYSDQEIIEYFGYTGGFGTREALIYNIYVTLIQEGFMLFNQISTNRATNSETLMLTPINEVLKPYLAFGSGLRYRVLELDELLSGFHDNIFRKIGVDGQTYTQSQISRLQVLLPTMRKANPQLSTSVEQLLQIVKSGSLALFRRNESVERLIRELNKMTVDEQKLVRQVFYQVFYAGMYMRKWRGPGNRYPLQGSETRSSYEPRPTVVLALGELYNMLGKLPKGWFDDLDEVDYNLEAEVVLFTGSKLFPFIRVVTGGTECIRMASRRLITSAYYYLGVCFNEAIPEFSPYDVEKIS